MGIKNLKKLIRGHYKTSSIDESLIQNINISRFSYEKVAIDISSYIYKYKAVNPDEWLNSIQMFICMLKKANVHGTFCFDGKPPPEKQEECKRRRETSSKLEEKTFNLSFDLDRYKMTNEITTLLKETMVKISSQSSNITRIGRLLHGTKVDSISDCYIDIEAIETFIKKKEDQAVKISNEDIEDVKKMITLFGGKFIQCPGEAEALCAYLFSIGDVKAVVTEDSDILCYGVESYISGLNASTGDCEQILLSDVLHETQLNLEEFRDFCIMCGTDYGDNIPGVGTANALKMIQKYRSIEKYVESTGKDPSSLNHKNSRELFTTFGRLVNPTNPTNCDLDKFHGTFWETDIDFDKLFDFLSCIKCRFSSRNIEEIWKIPDIIFDGE